MIAPKNPTPEPAQVQERQTLAFVQRYLPVARARILDVGCGEGALASDLRAAGHVVTAIDGSAEAVAAAQDRGVAAQQADFLAFSGGPFDALVFSFSLHHMEPLPAALERARALLAPQGRLILEEFAFERIDPPTALFHLGLQDVLLAAGALSDQEPSGVLHPDADPLATWHRWRDEAYARHHQHHQVGTGQGHHPGTHHGHHEPYAAKEAHREPEEMHTAETMRAQVAKGFELLHEEDGPGLYRFWLSDLNPEQTETAHRLLALERAAIAAGTIRALGIRWVARPR